MPSRRSRRSLSGNASRSLPSKGHIGGRRRAPQQIVELGSAGRIGRDHLAVENCLVEIEQGRQLVAELVKAAHQIAVARDETAAPLLDIAHGPKAVVFAVEEPIGVVERLLSPGRDNRLDAGKHHPADMARSVDVVHAAVPRAESPLAWDADAAARKCALLRFSRSVMRRFKCPSHALSFSIRTKIRSNDSAIVSSVTSLFSM